jgi:hypothetical protein
MNKSPIHRLLTLTLLVTTLLAPAIDARPGPRPARAARPGAQTVAATQRQTAAMIWQRTELYFGSAKPDGTVVTEAEFMQFIDDTVTPRFPDGLTVLTGYGQFRNSAGVIVKERSMELILLYPPSMRDANRKIEEIRAAYKQAFQQESVLRVDSLAAVSF